MIKRRNIEKPKMPLMKVFHVQSHQNLLPIAQTISPTHHLPSNLFFTPSNAAFKLRQRTTSLRTKKIRSRRVLVSASLDLTEDNIKQVLVEARTEASLLPAYLLTNMFVFETWIELASSWLVNY